MCESTPVPAVLPPKRSTLLRLMADRARRFEARTSLCILHSTNIRINTWRGLQLYYKGSVPISCPRHPSSRAPWCHKWSPSRKQRFNNFIHVKALYIMQEDILWVLDTRGPKTSELRFMYAIRCAGEPELTAINLSSDSILRNLYSSVKFTLPRFLDEYAYISICEKTPQFLMENYKHCGFKR
jgi:hypothetical protein